ncbi:hypothetical protein ACFCYN_18705 [Gottfriedia sp. NPDC056225]|uniref:hypothetical protein n=1 Tax=Gottfriedia sp. NPDC056225 TaxID=3345751 RepID=UPI0035D765C8
MFPLFKFQEPNIHRVYRRLRKLEGKNYLIHETIAHKVGVYLGKIEAKNLTNVSATVLTKVFIYTMQHDLLLTDLGLYYEFQARAGC